MARSLKLWSFYCDLEESLGTLESTRAVYDQILELRIATPQIILNYALFLQVPASPRAHLSRTPVLAHSHLGLAYDTWATAHTMLYVEPGSPVHAPEYRLVQTGTSCVYSAEPDRTLVVQ